MQIVSKPDRSDRRERQFNLRLTEPEYRRYAEAAAHENRSVSNWIRTALEQRAKQCPPT